MDSSKPLKHPQSQRKGQGQTCPTMHFVERQPASNLFIVTNGAKHLMVKVNKQEIPKVIDTRASLSNVSKETLNIISSGLDLKPSH